MFNKQVRTRLTLLKEDNSKPETEDNIQQDRYRRKYRKFEVGTLVMVRDYRDNNETWVPAKIKRRISKTTYICKLESGHIWKRHVNQ